LGRLTIRPKLIKAANGAITYTAGTLKGLLISGLLILNTNTEIDVNMKANKAPILQSSAKVMIGRKPERRIPIMVTAIVATYGVLLVLCTFENTGGSKPSLERENRILVVPRSITIITVVMPTTAPIATSTLPHLTPMSDKTYATGAELSSFL